MAEPIYTTAADVRTELAVDNTVLDDAAAALLITDAEDLIDRLLGGYDVSDQTTGRKVAQGDVAAWQWVKLGRATAKMAAAIYRDPLLLTGQRYESESGPDFSTSGASGAAFGQQIIAILDDSQLRRLAGHARSGRYPMKQTYLRFLRATRHNGT